MSDYRDVAVYIIVDDDENHHIIKHPMTWNYDMVDGPEAIANEIQDILQRNMG